MQYMLLICGVESAMADPDSRAAEEGMDRETAAWVGEMTARGVRRSGSRLRPTSDATTVRVRGGEALVSDGPFAETKEQILGYDLIECDDLDQAIEVAVKHPVARFGTIEVRPLWPS
jgi:hypothetical protein